MAKMNKIKFLSDIEMSNATIKGGLETSKIILNINSFGTKRPDTLVNNGLFFVLNDGPECTNEWHDDPWASVEMSWSENHSEVNFTTSCPECEETKTMTFSTTEEVMTAPTCTTTGWSYHYVPKLDTGILAIDACSGSDCGGCELSKDPLNHPTDNIISQPYEQLDSKYFTYHYKHCDTCGENLGDEEHTRGNAQNVGNEDTHSYNCTVCGVYITDESHTLNENNICTKCGYEKHVHDYWITSYDGGQSAFGPSNLKFKVQFNCDCGHTFTEEFDRSANINSTLSKSRNIYYDVDYVDSSESEHSVVLTFYYSNDDERIASTDWSTLHNFTDDHPNYCDYCGRHK